MVEKWQSWIFEKNSCFGDIRENVSKLAQNQGLSYFSQNGSNDCFFVFGLNLVLNMTFNLNETYFLEKFAIWRYLTSKSWSFGLASKLRNSKTADPFCFWFSSLKLVFNYHFHMNVTRSTQKLPFPRFLTLKMVPKPFGNYPKIEVFGQFSKNSSKDFPDFRWSSQCILVLIDIGTMFPILEGTIVNVWPDGMATFQMHNFGRVSHIQVYLSGKSKPYLIGSPQFQAFE